MLSHNNFNMLALSSNDFIFEFLIILSEIILPTIGVSTHLFDYKQENL